MKPSHSSLRSFTLTAQPLISKLSGLRSIIKHCNLLVLLLGWLILGVPSLRAQEGQFAQNKKDQTRRSNARVDPVTLGLNLQITLGGYPGRGGAELPISLNYSSKMWSEVELPETGTSQSPLPNMAKARFAVNSIAGWTSSVGIPTIEFTGRNQTFNSYGYPCAGCYTSIYYLIPRLHVHMPGGSTHELRKSDTPIATLSAPTEADFSGIFFAVDGSRLRYDTTTKTLYLPDGARYELGDPSGELPPASAPLTKYIDRNGNTHTYSPSTKKWTDTMAREIGAPIPSVPAQSDDIWTTSPNGQAVGDVPYVLKGLNASNLNFTLRWKKLEDALTITGQQLHYTGSHFRTQHPTAVPGPYLFGSEVAKFAADSQLFNPVVLAEIILPNNQSYKFTYNPWGEMDKIVYPGGGYERLSYQFVSSISRYGININRGVVERRVSAKGDGTDEAVWQYAASYAGANYVLPYTVKITEPNGTRAERLLYTNQDPMTVQCGYDNALAGMAYEERIYSSGNQLLRRILTEWTVAGPTPGGWSTATRDPRITKQISILFEANSSNALAQMTTTEYDSHSDPMFFAHLNAKATRSYHFVSVDGATQNGTINALSALFASQQPARIDETDYLYHSDYSTRNFTFLPLETRVKDGAGNIAAKNQLFYDEVSYPVLTYAENVSQWTDPGSAKRGNLTTARSYINPLAGTYVEVHSQFDQFGNSRKSWDAKGNVSETQYSSGYGYAYPTLSLSAVPEQIPDPTGPHGANTAFQSASTYDPTTGLALSTTDANGQLTTFEYNDLLNRLTAVIPPAGGARTNYEYSDQLGNIFSKTKVQLDASRWIETTQYMDGLGRTWRTTRQDALGVIQSDTVYDQMGRIEKMSNPYRAGESVKWTIREYDSLSRGKKIKTPDMAEALTEYGLATSGSVLGVTVTSTDQAGKKRRGLSDASGRLIRVDEPNSQNDLGEMGSPAQPTGYVYDVLGNLLTVTQGQQVRTFVYDSLSRLSSSTNPESGAVSYTYDPNGNLLSETDARGVTATNIYDAVDRVIKCTYTASPLPAAYTATPEVQYYYDGVGMSPAPMNAKGKLTRITNGISTTEYQDFDASGRVTKYQQITGGYVYPAMEYAYDLAGNLVWQKYPSGRTAQNSFNANGQLMTVSGRVPNRTPKTYASNFAYTTHGAVNRMQLGNGRWENTQFNDRLQPTQLGLGTTATGTDLLKLEYHYGTTNNNGNVLEQKITVPTAGGVSGFTATQAYQYDTLNRLQVATEHSSLNPSQPSWKQSFTYDQFGNRRLNQNETSTLPQPCQQPICNPTINPLNNRLDGHAYDAAGNLKQDAMARQFKYDGENRQTEYWASGAQTPTAQYFYDGEGQRVKKIEGNLATIFVYSALGQLVAEYTVNAPPPQGQIKYLTNDALGSSRSTTNASGVVTARYDFLPFGEELPSGTGGRASQQGYFVDDTRQKFTGQERDSETNLDFFDTRYYSSAHGRFTSIDPMMGSGTAEEPQTWNRYAYVDNNPLRYVDTDGMLKRESGSLVFWQYITEFQEIIKRDFGNSGRDFRGVEGYLRTDKGNKIEAFFSTDKGSRDGDANCHGLTFADGEFGIGNDEILGKNNIIADDGYQQTTEANAQAGDVVVYEEKVGNNWEVVHSATVVSTKDGVKVAGVNGPATKSSTTTVGGQWKARTNEKTKKPNEVRSTIFTKPSMTAAEREKKAATAANYDKSKKAQQDRINRMSRFIKTLAQSAGGQMFYVNPYARSLPRTERGS